MSGETHEAVHRHEAPTSFIRKYIFSLDHKVIGIQYIILALVAVVVGMTMSVLMRLNLSWPGTHWPILGTLFPNGAPGGVMNPEFYLSLVTMHGTIMVFFVLTTAPQGGFGNYFLPIQIGAEDMAFPFLNMMSFWITLVGFIVILTAIFVEGNTTIANSALGVALGGGSGATVGPIGGWTGYAPLSAVGMAAGPGQGAGMNLWIVSIAIFCVGSLLGALNFITTLLNMRTRGMTLMRMPLTCWAWFTTAVLALLSFPVLLGGGILLFLDRVAGTSFFIPGGLVFGSSVLTAHSGGSPILWQHLFWFFGHPEVYIAILPGMGATSHILSTFARKPIFGYRAMVFAIFAIGLLGFFVWGHHMFISGMSPYSAMTFSILTLSIGVPSAVKTFNWLGTLWGAKIRFTTPMLFAIGFVSLFVAGGITGLVLGQTSLDLPIHDTYFVLAHFHLVMGVASIFGMFAAIYFWFPKMFGRFLNERLGKIHFWITFVGVYCIFVPMHTMGMVGMPRRYAQFTEYRFLDSLHPLIVFVSIAAIATVCTQILFYFNLVWSVFKGKKASANPWEATTLEWTTSSPPPHDNFAGVLPVVYRGPYEFAVPGAPNDFVMQTEPDASEVPISEGVGGDGHNGHRR
ncbi:MAG TPA: cytochrome c oxidase subunit I [Blastocatellia bacterium]|jgi:cytochrome c oxidase subunit 1|nr:cytochrome c oxidase subunit I [Blastocatellia bacterium]HAF25096.1 cytochrome c oxidase subunit I [Blastocatellia bacterium]